MFRLLIVVLAIVGLVSIFSGGAGSGAAWLLALALVPIVLFKLFVLMMIFGFFGRKMWRHGPPRGRWNHHRRGTGEASSSTEDRFDEWHRLAHAREEVDSWVEGLPDDA